VSVPAWRDAIIARGPQPLGHDAIAVTARHRAAYDELADPVRGDWWARA
jgi:hypothetical protein